jgi:hypothetical protein
MMIGYYAALAQAELVMAEARIRRQQEALEREIARQQEEFERLRRQHEEMHGTVIDVEAREVPDAPALPAPTTE